MGSSMRIDKSVRRHEVVADHGPLNAVWVGEGCKYSTFASAEYHLLISSGFWTVSYPYATLDVRFTGIPAVGDTITVHGDDTDATITVGGRTQ